MKVKGLIGLALMVSLTAGLMTLGQQVNASIKAGDITGGKEAPHINIAVFHKLHGQESFSYPATIKGNILGELKGKAQFIFINHTAGLEDKDVVVVGNDVLRDNAGSFEDFGVDCQMSVGIKGAEVSMGGMCEVLIVDQHHRQIENKLLLKPVSVPSGDQWSLVFNDEEDGIAIYANQKTGTE